MGPSGEGEKKGAVMWASPRQGNGEERRDSRAFRRVLGGDSELSETCLEMMQVRERSRAVGTSLVWVKSGRSGFLGLKIPQLIVARLTVAERITLKSHPQYSQLGLRVVQGPDDVRTWMGACHSGPPPHGHGCRPPPSQSTSQGRKGGQRLLFC